MKRNQPKRLARIRSTAGLGHVLMSQIRCAVADLARQKLAWLEVWDHATVGEAIGLVIDQDHLITFDLDLRLRVICACTGLNQQEPAREMVASV